MEPVREDPIALLKKAEEEAQARVESSRREAAIIVKKANERATVIIDEALSEASAARDEAYESFRSEAVGAAKAAVLSAEADAGKLRLRRLDDEAVSKCLKIFLGGFGV
ncbi:MAG: hypothetical protein V1875_07595 [Candidatus Altiarchaeota archaeon]